MTTKKKIKVSLYEDNNSLRQGLVHLIGLDEELEMIGNYPNPINILKEVEHDKPDVILMDIGMPGLSGIDAVTLVRKTYPELKIVMQTVFDDDDKVFHSICAGAVGYILKNSNPQDVLDAIKQAYEGGAPMTPKIAVKVLKLIRGKEEPVNESKINLSAREKEILTLLTIGLSYKMIAEEVKISIDTVRFHIKNIYEKLHVHSMTEAVAKTLREKLI